MPRENRGTRLADRPNSDGYWEITWTENGRSRRRSTGTRSRRSAEKFLAAFIIERERIEQAEEGPPDIAALVSLYEDEHIRERAVDVERALMCGQPIKAFFGPMLPTDITDAILLKYRRSRAGRSDATIRRELEHLRAALNHAVRNRRLRLGDVPHIALPPKVEPRNRVLTPDEMRAILTTYVDEDRHDMIRQGRKADDDTPLRLSRVHRFAALALHAPARRRAIETLTWFQVDLEKRLIDYRMPGRQRTKKRRVAVPISSALWPIIVRAHAERKSEYVLDNPGSIKKTFATLMRQSGVKGVTPHVLRHTYITNAIANGVPPALVAEIVGDTIETIMRNYKHLMPHHLRDAVEGAWGPAQQPALRADR